MPEKRIPTTKPMADLTEVYMQKPLLPEGDTVTRYTTKYGKKFERVESPSRGVAWYMVVQS